MGRQPCWMEAVCAHILVAGVDPSVLLHIGLETVASANIVKLQYLYCKLSY